MKTCLGYENVEPGTIINEKERKKTMDGCDSCGRSKNNEYQMKSDAEPEPSWFFILQ